MTYNYPGATKGGKDALPVCAAENVQNKAVTLRGNQNSAFIGRAFWNTSTSDTVGGGSVISYVSDDRNTVIADGTTFIDIGNFLAPNKDAVTFRLTAKRGQTGTSLACSNLERATTESGNMTNPGFNKIGVWSGARPLPVLGSLKKTVDTINTCLGTLYRASPFPLGPPNERSARTSAQGTATRKRIFVRGSRVRAPVERERHGFFGAQVVFGASGERP